LAASAIWRWKRWSPSAQPPLMAVIALIKEDWQAIVAPPDHMKRLTGDEITAHARHERNSGGPQAGFPAR